MDWFNFTCVKDVRVCYGKTWSQFNSGIWITYLKKNGIGIDKLGIEIFYKTKTHSGYLLQAIQYWEAVGPIQGDGQLQTGYNVRSTFQTGLVPEWRVPWCPQSADFPGGVIVTNNFSRVYGIELLYLEFINFLWNWPNGIDPMSGYGYWIKDISKLKKLKSQNIANKGLRQFMMVYDVIKVFMTGLWHCHVINRFTTVISPTLALVYHFIVFQVTILPY